MATFQNTVTIRRPVEDVFAFLADFENVPKWNKAILRTRKTSPGPVGVGTTYRQVRTVPSTSEEGFDMTGFEPPRRLEVHGDIGPFAATIGYVLAPMGDSTQLTNAVDLAPSSGALRLLAPLAAFRVKAAWRPTSTPSRGFWRRGGRRPWAAARVAARGPRGSPAGPAGRPGGRGHAGA